MRDDFKRHNKVIIKENKIIIADGIMIETEKESDTGEDYTIMGGTIL